MNYEGRRSVTISWTITLKGSCWVTGREGREGGGGGALVCVCDPAIGQVDSRPSVCSAGDVFIFEMEI